MMNRLLGFSVLVVLCIATPIDKLKISSPKELSEKFPLQGLPVNIANYGYVPYGKNLMGTLYIANPGLACDVLDTRDLKLDDPTPIFIVERGNCTFVTKSKHAEIAGAKLVIIIDNINEDVNSIMIRDDGFGKQVSIPSIMISSEDGEKIITYIKSQNTSVSVAITFPMPKQKEKVSVELWLSASDKKSYEMIEELTPLLEKLEGNIEFKPRYVTWFCKFCGEREFKVKDDKCLSGGRYCNPDADLNGNIRGKDFVFESLRQICIFRESSLQKYLGYLKAYNTNCLSNNANLTLCGSKLVHDQGLNQADINVCITTSFAKTGNDIDMSIDDNWLLSKERSAYVEEKIQKWPSVLVNDETFKGDIDQDSLLEYICESFYTEPTICLKIDAKGNYTTSEGVKLVILIPILILSVLLVMVVVLYLYRRHIKNQLNKDISIQVNTALSQYFALNDRSFHAQTAERPKEKALDIENEKSVTAEKKDEI